MIAGIRPELGNVHGTFAGTEAAHAVKFFPIRPVCATQAVCPNLRHGAYIAVMLTGFSMLNGDASGPSNLKLVASCRIWVTFGTALTFSLLAPPPIVPPGNGWLKKPTAS
jgi:hypothetical protein